MSASPITPNEIGTFIDSIAGHVRTESSVAGRLLEEVVELCLASGLSAGQILAHVADSLHNQSLKASATTGHTVFPSNLHGEINELPEECADVSLLVKDICHVAGIDIFEQEQVKFSAFKLKTFRVTEKGTVYAVKPHVVNAEPIRL